MQNTDDLDAQASALVQKIKHVIISTWGRTSEEATMEEFYLAFCSVLREEMMINWTAAIDTINHKKARTVFFLSMEYLPGRFLGYNIRSMGADALMKAVLKKMNRSFSDLIACETDPGLGNGGLGRLSSCFLDSLATLHYPARAYGLRYQYGIFEQEIWNGIQIERPDCWLLNGNPWEVRRDSHAVAVHFKGRPISVKNMYGDDIDLLEDYEEVRAIPYETPIIGYPSSDKPHSVLMMRLWSTKDSPRNFQLQRYNAGFFEQAAENTSLTDVLYPNDNNELGKRIRLKQEFLLVSASLQDIIHRSLRLYGDLNSFADHVRIQINDTHPAFLIAELMRNLTKNYNFSWKLAWETCQTVCSYTNHTILPEALEEWNEQRVRDLLPRQYRIIQKLNQDFCDSVRRSYPEDESKIRRISVIEGGQIRMSHLAILGSHKINGVAKLHTEILKQQIFPDFFDLFPDKWISITNGISQRRWLLYANPLLSEFVSERIGSQWITDFSYFSKLANYASDRTSIQKFLEIKKLNKESLITFLTQENVIRNASGKVIAHCPALDPSCLFDVHIKRFHEYKRQLMSALHLIMIYQELKADPKARKIRRFSLFGGKAAPGYVKAKQILALVCAICRKFEADPDTNHLLSAVFVENYNVSKAEKIIPAADLSEQISLAGWEASGTGNMKLAINGALTIGTEDGANIEMHQAVGDAWWPFSFGAPAEGNKLPYKPWDVYISDEPIRRAIDALKDDTFSTTAAEKSAFSALHGYLTESDPYRVLQDLRSYYETQKKVEKLFAQQDRWAETALRNMAAMTFFSSDRAIQKYAEKVWGITPCPPDPAILEKVKAEYSEHDRCRIRTSCDYPQII